MNCRRFQNRLYEYVDGTLSARAQAAANKHLAQCSACRQALHQEQQVAQFLSDGLRQGTGTLCLRPEIARRILRAPDRIRRTDNESIGWSWNRLAWPLAIAAYLLLLVTFWVINYYSALPFLQSKASPGERLPSVDTAETGPIHEMETAQPDHRDIHSAVSIQVSYRVPIHKFRREGNLVVDTLSYATVVASGTLHTGSQQPVQQKPELKMPL
jgi:hypothetical protein